MKIKLLPLFISLIIILTGLNADAQVNKNSILFKTLKSKDSLLFNIGFNRCDISQFENLVSDNFEFYHDKGGITKGKAAFIESIKNGLCHLSYQPRRALDTATLQVFALNSNGVLYGAIQTGVHSFYEKDGEKPEYLTSTAKFTHVWLLENNEWKLARGLSYDHLTPTETQPQALFNTDDKIENWLKENHVPVLGLGVIEDGKLRTVKVYGELKPGDAAPYNTVFNVASITKTMTNMVALKLVGEGKLDLDEPLYKYWIDPDLKGDERYKLLTTRLILTHQTGFANWRWLNKSKKLEFAFSPGTKYQYSGEGFEYLRRALEAKFHKTLDVMAQEMIFTPLQMNDTRYIWNNSVEDRFAIGYDPKGKTYPITKNTTANAADLMTTTVEDYGKFAVALMNGEVLKPAVFDEMVKHQVALKENKYFGLGWEIFANLSNSEYCISHGGADDGVRTQVFLFPKTKRGLIIFTNVDDGYKVYEKLLTEYFGQQGKQIMDIEMKN